jgi:hypothetical protein
MGVLIEVNARQGGQLGSSVAELEDFFRNSIFARDPVEYACRFMLADLY